MNLEGAVYLGGRAVVIRTTALTTNAPAVAVRGLGVSPLSAQPSSRCRASTMPMPTAWRPGLRCCSAKSNPFLQSSRRGWAPVTAFSLLVGGLVSLPAVPSRQDASRRARGGALYREGPTARPGASP